MDLFFIESKQLLVIGTSEGSIKILNLIDYYFREVITIHGHIEWVNKLIFLESEKVFLSGSTDQSLKIWSLNTYKQIKQFKVTNEKN